MELIEIWFLISVSSALSCMSLQCCVTLGGRNEHFTANDGVSAYVKYVSGNVDINILFSPEVPNINRRLFS